MRPPTRHPYHTDARPCSAVTLADIDAMPPMARTVALGLKAAALADRTTTPDPITLTYGAAS